MKSLNGPKLKVQINRSIFLILVSSWCPMATAPVCCDHLAESQTGCFTEQVTSKHNRHGVHKRKGEGKEAGEGKEGRTEEGEEGVREGYSHPSGQL